MLSFGCFLLLFAADFLWIVCGNNTTSPRPGSSWMKDDDEEVDGQRPTKYGPRINFFNEAIRNIFATFTCDEVVQKQVSPGIWRSDTKAFKQLKYTLKIMFNFNFEVLDKIKYFNSKVAGREERCRIQWTDPEAKAALIHYQNELEIEGAVLNRPVTRTDIMKMDAFKRLKCSIENIFHYNLDNEVLFSRADKALKRELKAPSLPKFRQDSNSAECQATTSVTERNKTLVKMMSKTVLALFVLSVVVVLSTEAAHRQRRDLIDSLGLSVVVGDLGSILGDILGGSGDSASSAVAAELVALLAEVNALLAAGNLGANQSLLEDIQQLLQQIISSLTSGDLSSILKGVEGDLVSVISSVQSELGSVLNDVLPGVATPLPNLGQGLGALLSQINALLATGNITQGLLGQIQHLLEAIVAAI